MYSNVISSKIRCACRLALALSCGLSPRLAVAQDPNWVELHGDVEPKAVHLSWTVTRWPDGVTGFVVKRRPAAGEGAWQPVHPGTIEPGVSPAKDFTNVEPDEAARGELVQKLQTELSRGRVMPVSSEEFFRKVRNPPEDFFGALRRELFLDPDRALWLGLGCVDRKVNAEDAYEYGLFPVQGGSLADNAAAKYVMPRFSRNDPRLRVSDLRVAGRDIGTTLSWRFEESKVREWAIYGFRVYRVRRNSDRPELLTPLGVGSARVEDTWRYWTFADNTAVPGTDYRYRIIPFNYFQRELDAVSEVDFAPSRDAALAQASMTLTVVQDAAAKQVSLSWNLSGLPEADISGFVVERAQLPDGPLQPISGTLPASARTLLDREVKRHEDAYAYRVSALGAGAPLLSSNAAVLVYLDLPTPPNPTGVRAEWLMLGANPAVQLNWDAVNPNDKITRGYIVYADLDTPGTLERQASVAETKTPQTQALLPLRLLESRMLDVGVAAVGPGGLTSAVARARVFAPGRLPASVSELTADPSADAGTATLRWRYPEDHEILGFRITANGALVADEAALKPDARSWRYQVKQPRSEYRFEVVAVSVAGETSMSREAYLSPSAPPTVAVKPAAPTNVRVRWLPGDREIAVTWDVPASGATAFDYAVSVDEGTIGKFGEPKLLGRDSPGRFVYVPADPGRSYGFRLWALGPADRKKNRPSSIYVESLCLAPGRTLAPARVERVEAFAHAPGNSGIRVFWNYPPSSLAGFRLYLDGALIRREKEIESGARQYTLPLPDKPGAHRYALEAVGEKGEISERAAAFVFVLR